MQIGRVYVGYSNFAGAPGVNVLHWAEVGHVDIDNTAWATMQEQLIETYNTFRQRLAGGITIQIPQECHIIEADSGTLVGMATTDELPDPIVSTAGTSIGGATMLLAQLHTGDIRNGRLVRGRVNVGPVADGVITGGTVLSAAQTDIVNGFQAASDPLGPRLGVWSRPTTSGGSDGQFSDVTGVTCWNLPAVLRSRRT